MRISACLLGCGQGEDSCLHYGQCGVVWQFMRAYLGIVPKFSSGKDIWCLAAPPDADSLRQPHYWCRIGVGQYAVMRATNALRAGPEVAPASDEGHRKMAWRCLRAGLAEALRGVPGGLLASIRPTLEQTPPQRRQREDEGQEAAAAEQAAETPAAGIGEVELAVIREAPPRERIRRLLALI